MKFTKRILIMTALAVTAVVSTGFAYDYCMRIILSTIAILAHNTTVITTLLVTILAKAIVAQTQIQEDAADIEDNLVSILKAIVQMYYRLLSYITRILFNSSKYS